ncbi:3-carboxymuconate cyclase [Metarhizium robertsii ARSEF 23]|uniref:3-carboxymuconate cyclase n=2 Tax=Metarhizium robertsii TaxID=568076 RepID=E9FAC7_METRA|nr:3-carboxymuconate cyclase [Metarhizium robertsii ARSEF 23]EFY95277.1 3-carboxymuconate cyclase [Metarhizium robertsii ARSEF 23]
MKYSTSLAVLVGLAKAGPLLSTATVNPGNWQQVPSNLTWAKHNTSTSTTELSSIVPNSPRPTIGVQEFLTLSQSFKFEIRSGRCEITNLPGSAAGFFWRVVYDLDLKGSFRFETCEREQHGRVFTKIQGQYVLGYAVKYSQVSSGAELICDSGVLSYVKVQSSGVVVTAVTESTVIEKYSNTMYACTEAAQCVPSKCEGGCEKGVKDDKDTSPSSCGGPIPKPGSSKRALFFLDSNPDGASIIGLPILQDGSLDKSRAVRTPTGGRGSISQNMNGTVSVDPLFSQDSVVVNGKYLYTVNSGSNTLARFEIPDADPASPKLVGEPVHTGGEFPNSVAVSDKNDIACVTNTGRRAGVQCFKTLDRLQPLGDYMPLPINQTTPPVGPPNSVSDIVFNPSQTALFVTIKGNGMGPGYVYAYQVANGRINPQPVISRPPGLLLDFSLTFLSDSAGVVTDPAYGASYISIARNLSVAVSNKITVPGQGATCWSVFAREFDTVYLSDGASPNITALDPVSGRTKFVITGDSRSTGSFDSAVDRSSLYVLQGSAAVAVFHLQGSKSGDRTPSLSQYLDLSSFGARSGWIGMAVYSG